MNFAPCLLALPALCQHSCRLPVRFCYNIVHALPQLSTPLHTLSSTVQTLCHQCSSLEKLDASSSDQKASHQSRQEMSWTGVSFSQNRPSSQRKALRAPWVTSSSKLRVTASCHHNSIRACILMLLDCCHIIHICFITAHLLNVQDIYLWFFQNEKEKKNPDTVELVLVLFRPFKLGHCKLFKQLFLCHHIQVTAPSHFLPY